MITNPEMIITKYKCGKILGRYLSKYLPILSIKDGFYYFSCTPELDEILNKLPVWFRILKNF